MDLMLSAVGLAAGQLRPYQRVSEAVANVVATNNGDYGDLLIYALYKIC